MKRSVAVTGAAFVGAAWLFSYKVTPHPPAVASLSPSPPPTQSPVEPSSSPSGGGQTPKPSPSPSPTPSAAVTGSFTGSDVPNRFGDVKVRVIITNGHITDVQALQLPNDREQSAYISQVAGPMLRSEVLQAQSAQIDIISGATYTSESYAQSVETALQQAHMG
jgi:uncharacterized protein with FMN-binding domain